MPDCAPGRTPGAVRLAAVDWGLWVVGVVGIGIAVWAGPNTEVAAPAAALGLLAAVVWAARSLDRHRTRSLPARLDDAGPEADLLRSGFRTGPIGRAAVLATLAGIEADLLGPARRGLTLEEEQQLLAAPPDRFRSWVEERLAVLEAAS